jgi:UPF0755 protein
MRRLLRALLSLIVVGAIVVVGGAASLWYQYGAPGPLAEPKNVVIPRGTGTSDIAEHLVEVGVLASPYPFAIITRVSGASRNLKFGEYAFTPGMSPREVAELLASGKTVMRRVTVAEGLMTVQAVALFRQAEGLVGEITTVPAEGAIMPATYDYSWGDDRARLLERAVRGMSAMVAELWPRRAPGSLLTTPEQAVVLASIVERETGKAEERPRVAAVFLNRLKRGMRLQADPTVAYGVTGGKSVLDRPLSRADLDARTAWNTYVITGLPPTPIANPGRASLVAVLNPAPGNDLYFVADGTGGHAFAETLDEHNRNVTRLRQIERDRASSPRP